MRANRKNCRKFKRKISYRTSHEKTLGKKRIYNCNKNGFNKKKIELINLIKAYLNKDLNIDVLNNFAWEMIDYFSTTQKEELPPLEEFEKEFWYAIWQIQHLSDHEHEIDGITKKELKNALDFLLHKKKILPCYSGRRP